VVPGSYQVRKNLGDADDRAAANDPIALPPPQEATVMKGLYISVAPAAEVKHYERAANRWEARSSGAFLAARFLLGDKS
jgi:hypothetical protein